MNPFLHPAVATPLEPEDIPAWRPDVVSPAPEPSDRPGRTMPVGSDAGEHAEPGPSPDPVPDTMRMHVLRVRGGGPLSGMPAARTGSRGVAGVQNVDGLRGAQGIGSLGGAQGVVSAPARMRPSWQPLSRWRSRLGSLAFMGVVGLGACTGALAQPAQVNANVATAAELETIKGIGPKTARSIVSERQRSGLFESFQDFSERIRGIGAKRAASLRAAGLVIGPPVSPPAFSAPAGPGTGGAPVGVLVR